MDGSSHPKRSFTSAVIVTNEGDDALVRSEPRLTHQPYRLAKPMLENIRKYTGLMIIVIILLAAGLILTMNNTQPGGSQNIMTVNGISVSNTEYYRSGSNAGKIIYYFTDQASAAGLAANNPTDFIANRLIIRSKAHKMGIYAGDAEITEKLQKSRIFAGENGDFDSSKYTDFIKNLPGAMTEGDLQSLIGDLLLHDKIKEVISGGISMPREQSLAIINTDQQSFTAETVEFKRVDYVIGTTPTEEQVKEFWEENRSTYMTDRMLKVSYVITTSPRPDSPKAPDLSGELSDEEKAKLTSAHQEELAALSALHDSNVNMLKMQFSEFTNKLEESEGRDFIANDSEDGWKDLEIQSTELIPESELRALLGNPQKRNRITGAAEGFIFDEIAKNEFGENLQALSDYYPVSPDGYFVMKVEESVEPKEMTFEQAKERATADVTTKLIDEALLAAAEEARKELAAEGSDFAEVAKKLKLEVKVVGPFKPNRMLSNPQILQRFPPQMLNKWLDEYELHKACQGVNTGDTAPVTLINEGQTAVIARLTERTLENNPQPELHANGQVARFNSSVGNQVFQAWLKNAYLAAEKDLPKSN